MRHHPIDDAAAIACHPSSVVGIAASSQPARQYALAILKRAPRLSASKQAAVGTSIVFAGRATRQRLDMATMYKFSAWFIKMVGADRVIPHPKVSPIFGVLCAFYGF